ncbi:MAG TPA: DUF2892 domain-containing protein [Terriglobales bacterium]|nr:DUF2892 domain-containing protein [Terriglobales bacterium]
MTIERSLRLIAGTFILASLALGHWVSPYWYLFTAFVGLNLFQSGFTNWCPMMAFLRRLGVPAVCEPGTSRLKAGVAGVK